MKFLLLIAALPLAYAITNYDSCVTGGTVPHTITISGCAEAPCDMVEGQTISAVAQVVGEISSSTLETKVTAYVGGISGPLAVPDRLRDGCQLVDQGCPVGGGQDVTFRFAIGLVNLQNEGLLVLEIGLGGDAGVDFMCARIPFNVIRGKQMQLV